MARRLSQFGTGFTPFEALLGIALLPKGKRRQSLAAAFDKLTTEALEDRVLDFDPPADEAATELVAGRQRQGETIDMRDTQIAGIVMARRAEFATRNVKHFSDLNVAVIRASPNGRDPPGLGKRHSRRA